ncbi:MAG: type 1 glutamine amidotransferase [Chloroflexi bacterium]|nr:type 1 glutamine amidotransferase [Chloroflexota bacterium]
MRRAVIVVAQGVEDAEFVYPYYRLQEAEFVVDVATKNKINLAAKHGLPISANVDAEHINEIDYDMLIIPGGYESPDRVRQIPNVLNMVRDFNRKGKIISSICHGPWVLISAGIVRGRNMTCYVGCKDDLINAGASYFDAPVVVDQNIVTSPHFRNNPSWMKETIAQFDRITIK